MKSILRFICCYLLLVAPPGNAQVQHKEATLPATDAVTLWEQAITAKGGRQKLFAVRNLLEAWDNKDYVSLSVFPDKGWEWEDDRPTPLGLSLTMQNVELALSYHLREESPELSEGGNAREVLWPIYYAQLYFLLETERIKPLPVKAFVSRHDGQPVDIVRTIVHFPDAPRDNPRGTFVDFHFDKKTRLPLKVAFPSDDSSGPNYGRGTYFVTFSHYVDVDGIQMPRKIGYLDEKPYAWVRVQANVEYDPRIFERAPSLEAGPDAWRLKK